MKMLVTGGAGDLGRALLPALIEQGIDPASIDLREPSTRRGTFVKGSILDRPTLAKAMKDVDCVVHIAAWHGIHLFQQKKDVYDFWDLNVTGTFNVFQAAAEASVKRLVYISSESVADRYGIYGNSKLMGEEIARTYAHRHGMNVVILRMRAFIPFWNPDAYSSWLDWAKWFWKGAVHIDDVRQSVLLSIGKLKEREFAEPPVLNIDGAYDYSAEDLATWDARGPGSTFRKYYSKYYDLAVRNGLDPALKPETLSIDEARRLLGYEPRYSLRNLLEELERFGAKGPPAPEL
ncbi:MAG: NAD(P)-dependent oxidoreductase [Spirochaetota bacterium]